MIPEPAVQAVLGCLIRDGFPQTSSGAAASVATLGEDALLGLLDGLPHPPVLGEAGPGARLAADLLLGEEGGPASNVGTLSVRLSDGTLDMVVASWDGDPRFHGMRLHSLEGEPVLCRTDMALAEALLYGIQTQLALGTVGEGRRGVDITAFAGSMGLRSLRPPSVGDVAADFGLRKRRLWPACIMLQAIAAADGLTREVPGDARESLPHSRMSRRVKLMEADNPLTGAFCRVEFSEKVSDETFRAICDGYNELLGAGLVVLVPSDLIAVRFRNVRNRRIAARYSPSFRDMVVPPGNIGTFVHEMAHATDAVLGRPSRSAGFGPLHEMYVEELEAMSPGDFDREYYESPSESFARCFEVYASTVVGEDCPLLPNRMGRFPYPYSERIRAMCGEYFRGLLATR